MRFCVIGKSGQLARALRSLLEERGIEASFLSRKDCDLSRPEAEIRSTILGLQEFDAVINCAAYTAVDAAETETKEAYAVNTIAPKVLASICRERSVPFVHISTDYVFNGQGIVPYQPEDATDPINVYGQTKFDGEEAIIASGCRASILRTSWVYDATGKNFLTTMLRLAATRDELSVVDDQKGRPTFAGDLAVAALLSCENLIDRVKDSGGVFHVSNSGSIISWAEFAAAIFQESEEFLGKRMIVHSIPSVAYPTPAKRPAYSAMDISKFERIHSYVLPHWKEGLQLALKQYRQERL